MLAHLLAQPAKKKERRARTSITISVRPDSDLWTFSDLVGKIIYWYGNIIYVCASEGGCDAFSKRVKYVWNSVYNVRQCKYNVCASHVCDARGHSPRDKFHATHSFISYSRSVVYELIGGRVREPNPRSQQTMQ